MGRVSAALAIALVGVACNPKSLRSGYCHVDSDCASRMCNMGTRKCVPVDASMDGADSRDARDGGDAGDAADAPFKCKANTECGDGGATVCEPDAGMCVICLENSDCLAKDTNAPICESRICRACKTDSECTAAPGICLPDGHCAMTTEVIFVEFNSNTCPGANGSSANPYCAPNDAVMQLESGKNVIVIRGPTADRLTIATTGLAPVIVGKSGASIPASAATAIQVMSDDVIIRDLTITGGGTASSSKGIVATGSLTKLTLSNVTVNLTAGGLGVQADSGAHLVMNRSTVTNNNRGGIFIDGATFDIKNTTVTANGPGDDMGASWGGLRFKNLLTTGQKSLTSLTVMNNNQVGVSCSGNVDASSVLVSGSSGAVEISPSCGFMSCGTTVTPTCGAQP